MSVSDFLKNLPVHDASNFSRLESDSATAPSPTPRSTAAQGQHARTDSAAKARSTHYVPTKEFPMEQSQVIVTETRNILLRHLHAQWNKKTAKMEQAQNNGALPMQAKKREASEPVEANLSRKRSRTKQDHS